MPKLDAEVSLYRPRTLFYPCAGRDIDSPISAFAALVDDFWFIDINCYEHRIPKPRVFLKQSPDVTERQIGFPSLGIRTHAYVHPTFDKTISLNFVTGDGEAAFDYLYSRGATERTLSVFFHRGDSQGEGGSNVYWLRETDSDGQPSDLLGRVLSTIETPGFICSDGSNAHASLASHFNESTPEPDTHSVVPAFTVLGSTLAPIGTLDTKYGPTVIWQVVRP